MEILEFIFVIGQACGCFADVFAIGSLFGSGITGVKARKTYLENKAARQAAEASPGGGDCPPGEVQQPPSQMNGALLLCVVFVAYLVSFILLLVARWHFAR